MLPMHSSGAVLVALLSRYSSRPRCWNGTRGPDSVRLAEGAGGLLVDAPPLLNLSSADWCASIGVDRERRVQMRNPAKYGMG